MRIRYETTVEDMAVFHDFYQKNAPELKRFRRKIPWMVTLLVMGLLVMGIVSGEWLPLLLPMTFGLTIYILFLSLLTKFLTKFTMKNAIKKQYQGEKARGILGEHELEIVADGLIERTEYTETKTAWALLDRVETTNGYTFLFTGPHKAYVVPHHAVIEGSLPAFLKAFGERYQPDGKLRASTLLTNSAAPNLPPDA